MSWIFVAASSAAASWSPSQLSSLFAWYDADDSSTITESGGDISQWEDKSGGGYHLSQATAANQPTYTSAGLNSKNVVTFNATHWMAASTASDWKFLHDSTGSSVFVVLRFTRADRMAFLWTSPFIVTKIGWTMCNKDGSDAYNLISTSGNTWTALNKTANNTLLTNTDYILGVVADPGNATAASRSSIRIDGGTATTNNTETNTPSTADPNSPLTLGRSGDSNMDGLEGFIAEIVICDATLSSTDREKVEGYLAHKWGLSSNLPVGHPYENDAPTI